MSLTAYSEYEDLSKLLNFRTSNLGLINLDSTTLSPNEDIFSYIDKEGIPLIALPSSSENLSEDGLMKGIIFNNTLINGTAANINASINYLLDNNKRYNLGDFSHNIKRNCFYYKDGFEYVNIFANNSEGNVSKDILDIDTSYYASQNAIKYLFLLDTVSEFYRLANENKGRKSDITNILSFFTIKCRYVINPTTKEWQIYKPSSPNSPHYYEITFADTLKIYPPVLNIIKTNNVSDQNSVVNSNTMINVFKEILTKHINYIKKADMMYASNFKKFFKLCRLMLNYNIIYNLKYLLTVNCSKITTNQTANNNCDDDIYFNYKTDYDSPPLITTINNDYNAYEYYYNHLMPKCKNSGYTTGYIIDILHNDNDGVKTPLSETHDIDATSQNRRIYYDNSLLLNTENSMDNTTTYRIVSFNSTDDAIPEKFLSKPVGKIFTYIPASKSSISITLNENNTIKSINGLALNTEYYIKLHNFSTINNAQITVNNNYSWDNNSKVLKIFATNTSNSVVINTDDKIYLISYIINTVNNAKSVVFTLPSEFDTPLTSMSILFTKMNSIDPSKFNIPQQFNINNYNLVTITYPTRTTGQISLPSLTIETGTSKYFYTNDVKLSVLKCVKMTDDNVFKLIHNYDKLKLFTISKDQSPSILPYSYEDCSYTASSGTSIVPKTSFEFLQYYYLPILSNFKVDVANILETDIKDNDMILRTMDNLSKVNKTISKNSGVVKTNHDQFNKEHAKVLSSGIVDKLAIIIFVITIVAVILLPNANLDKNSLLVGSGTLFVIVLILSIIIYSLIFTKYTEEFSLAEGAITYKSEVNSVIQQLLRNFYNERTRISEKVILPSLLKENKYFVEKDNRLKIFNKVSYSDLQIEERNKQRNVARITLLINISLIVATAFLINTVVPNLWKIILGVATVLLIIVIFIYFTQITKVVHTNANNVYWQKPDTSLDKLNIASNAAAPALM